jgi:LPXTG-motif cell wall-anchored protein
MPSTASPMPLVGLAGVVMLFGALGFTLRRRHA